MVAPRSLWQVANSTVASAPVPDMVLSVSEALESLIWHSSLWRKAAR